MSWIKDLKELPISITSAVVSIALIIPFWFISIYLFHKSFYVHSDLYIIFAFCICFSVTWYSLNLILSAIVIHYISDEEKEKEEFDAAPILILGGVVSIIYLSFVIFLAYWFDWTFKTFLIVAYSYSVLRICNTPFIVKFLK